MPTLNSIPREKTQGHAHGQHQPSPVIVKATVSHVIDVGVRPLKNVNVVDLVSNVSEGSRRDQINDPDLLDCPNDTTAKPEHEEQLQVLDEKWVSYLTVPSGDECDRDPRAEQQHGLVCGRQLPTARGVRGSRL